jgi:hypothetical protein
LAALHLARVPFPRLPISAPEFRRSRPLPLDADVLEQTRRARAALTALVGATHALLLLLVVALLTTSQTWSRVLGVVLAVAVLIRARHAGVRVQRAFMLATGGLALAVAALRVILGAEPEVQVAAAALAVGLAAACVAYARKAPGRSPSPYWGRALDVGELLVVASVVPIVVAIFDGYAAVRGLTG